MTDLKTALGLKFHTNLINPNHPDSIKIKVISTQRLVFDERFKQKKDN